jgi:hypothetical protein
MNTPNVYAGQKNQIGEGFSNMPAGDPLPAEFGARRVRPIVDDLLYRLGMQILDEQEWEDANEQTLACHLIKRCA